MSFDLVQFIDTPQGRRQARNILRQRYPYVQPYLDDEPEYILKQMIMAQRGYANPEYQEQYDSYIIPLLKARIGELVYLDNPDMFPRLYRSILYDPHKVREILTGDISGELFSEVLRLNNIAEGDGDTQESEFDIRFPVERQRVG